MKIALFNYSSSGLFHYSTSLVNALVELDEVSKIVFFTSKENNTDLINPHRKLTVIAQEAPHSLLPLLCWCLNPIKQRQTKNILRELKPDIVHINDTFPVYLLHYFTLRKYPVIFTQHDPSIHAGDSHSLPTRLIQKYLQKISTKVLVHSDTLKKDLMKNFKIDSDKIAVIPMGNFSILLKNKKRNITAIPRSILFFGRIVDYKGLDVLLNSLVILQEENKAFHLIIAGPGDITKYQDALRKIKHKTIDNYFIPEEKVYSYFKKSEIIVLPYKEATQSAVVALALSAGTPIIATRVGALPEVLLDGTNSLLVEPNNPVALKEKIIKLLGNKPQQQQLRQGGFKTISNDLSWEKISHIHSKLYQEIYEQNSSI